MAALAACLQRLPLHELLEASASECEPWLPEAAGAPPVGVAQAASARQGGEAPGEQHASEAASDRGGGPAAAAARRSPGSTAGVPEHAETMPSAQRAGARVQLLCCSAAATPPADAVPGAAPALPGAARGGPAPPHSLHPMPLPPAQTALATPQRMLCPQPALPAASPATSAAQMGPPGPAEGPPGADSELEALLATLMAPEPAPDANGATAALTPAPAPPRPTSPLVG